MLTEKKSNVKTSSTTKGFYRAEVINKFADALNEAKRAVLNGEPAALRVRISNANSKMGAVASVSTLPFLTCPAVCAGTCGAKCYAAKLANLRPSVLKSYAINTALALLRPDVYWSGIDYALKGVRYFRFHVSGDIINAEYFSRMIDAARNNPKTEILVFTKRYNVVNNWISENGELPANLHILFSGWNNLDPANPHNLPETNVIVPDMDTMPDNWKMCGGNCFNCACRGVGCWQAQKGDTIAFKLH